MKVVSRDLDASRVSYIYSPGDPETDLDVPGPAIGAEFKIDAAAIGPRYTVRFSTPAWVING